MFGLAAVGAVALVRVEGRQTEPLVDLRFFRSAPFSGAALIGVVALMTLSGFLFLNTLYLQETRGYSALHAGLLTIPMAAAAAVFSAVSGRIVASRDAWLPFALAGLLIALGTGLLTVMGPHTAVWYLILAYLLFGVGAGLVTAPHHQHRAGGDATRPVRRGGRDRLYLPPDRRGVRRRDLRLGIGEAEVMPANPLGVALRKRRAGHHALVWARPGLQAAENFTLTSPAFDHGTPIPEKHRGRLRGANISPALNWTPPPAGTAELVLIVQDPDVPFGKPATHALTPGIDPALPGIGENALASPSPVPGIRHGKGPLGRRGWAGPMPIRSHGPHAYVFQLFALDQTPGLPDGFTLDDVIAAITGHVIGRARLDGTYEIR